MLFLSIFVDILHHIYNRFIRTFLNEAIKHAKNEDIANLGKDLLLKLDLFLE